MQKKKSGEYLFQIVLVIASIVFIIIMVYGYAYRLEWVGVVGKRSTKTLWDWMELLIIPFVLTIGLWWLNKKQKLDEEAHDLDKFRESALQHYLDKLSELILNEDLKNPKVREIARARTFITLKMLDGKRKGLLLDFLSDSMLVTHEGGIEDSVIDLQSADFSNVQLEDGYLEDLVMVMADFTGANLRNAFLRGALMEGAKLDNADLTNADVSYEQLATVKSLEGAVMPSGKIYKSKPNNSEYQKIKYIRDKFEN